MRPFYNIYTTSINLIRISSIQLSCTVKKLLITSNFSYNVPYDNFFILRQSEIIGITNKTKWKLEFFILCRKVYFFLHFLFTCFKHSNRSSLFSYIFLCKVLFRKINCICDNWVETNKEDCQELASGLTQPRALVEFQWIFFFNNNRTTFPHRACFGLFPWQFFSNKNYFFGNFYDLKLKIFVFCFWFNFNGRESNVSN